MSREPFTATIFFFNKGLVGLVYLGQGRTFTMVNDQEKEVIYFRDQMVHWSNMHMLDETCERAERAKMSVIKLSWAICSRWAGWRSVRWAACHSARQAKKHAILPFSPFLFQHYLMFWFVSLPQILFCFIFTYFIEN